MTGLRDSLCYKFQSENALLLYVFVIFVSLFFVCLFVCFADVFLQIADTFLLFMQRKLFFLNANRKGAKYAGLQKDPTKTEL